MISRRAFVVQTSILAAAAFSRRRWTAPHILLIGVASPNNGAMLGVEEARHAASMFGGEVELVDPSKNASAMFGGSDPASCFDVAQRGALVLNIACGADELRGEKCAGTMFHVAPSDAMVRDAVMQVGGEAADARGWDASLSRFGADTLNDRFRARFNTGMTPTDWAAWMGIKILWESSLRVKSTQPQLLIEFLKRESTQFDGHKGRPLSFRSWDHQLRQPLYVPRGNSLVEVPEAIGDQSSRDVLDRLGTSADRSQCRIVK